MATPLLIWFQIDAESAFSRNIKRDRRRADDKYAAQWDRSSFEAITGHMQNPGLNEEYVVISGKHLYTTQQTAVVNKLRDKGILSLDDASAHVVKPGMVNLIPSANANAAAGRVDMLRRNITIR